MVAACGYQHIRMYDLASANPDPVLNYEGVVKNVSRVGFQVVLKLINFINITFYKEHRTIFGSVNGYVFPS